jgi:Tol biopolymer transport system component
VAFVAWSSDGSRLLYQERTEDLEHAPLVLVDPDGTEHRLTVDRAGSFAGASLSPDGRTIFVATLGNETMPSAIEVLSVDGSEHRVLREASNGALLLSPVVSPDGSRLVFDEMGSDGVSHVWVMDTDGTDGGVIFTGRSATESLGTLAWSPDGTRLAFAGTPEGSSSGLTLMGADGSAPLVVDGPAVASPTWSPDGSQIAFLADNAVCTIGSDGSGYRCLPVLVPLRYPMIAWNPGP